MKPLPQKPPTGTFCVACAGVLCLSHNNYIHNVVVNHGNTDLDHRELRYTEAFGGLALNFLASWSLIPVETPRPRPRSSVVLFSACPNFMAGKT